MEKVILLSVSILLISLAYSFAEVPCKINYQGRLIKDNVPVDGTKKMRFSIHDRAVGGDELWTSGEVDVTVHNGLFRYVLDLSSIDDWTAGETLYLEVKVGPDILTPREELYAYPYAINSHLLEGEAKGYFINTSAETQKKDGGLNIMGNVGIGTTSPSAPLDLAVTSKTAIEFDNGDSSITIHDGFGNFNIKSGVDDDNIIVGGAGGSHIRLDQAGYIHLWIDESTAVGGTFSAGTKLALNAGVVRTDGEVNMMSGNVGIGTTNPGAKLEVAGNFKATGGIEPDYDSGWVYVDRIGAWGLKTLTHNLNYFPRQIQWWFSNGNPGTFIGPLASNTYKDHAGNPLGIWITLTQIKFSIWNDRYVYRMYDASGKGWSSYNNGYYRFLLWK